MIDIDNLEKFITDGVAQGDLFSLRKEGWIELLTILRQAEKDAARYRWIKENSQVGAGRCGVDWELYFEGPAPDNSAMIERHIDEAMQCK